MMSSKTVTLTTRTLSYDKPEENKNENPSPYKYPPTGSPTSSFNGPLTIENPNLDMILHPPKSTLRKVVFNPNAQAAQFYNVVEDLAQTPCAMSTLEVLQSSPTQHKKLLTTLGATNPIDMNLSHFNPENLKPRLPHQLAFQFITSVVGKKVFRTVLDEGASTSVLSLPCWKAIDSPELVKSPTTLKSFDGRGFQPYCLMPTLSVQLGGKKISI